MGIEPLLLVLIVVGTFAVQAGRAVHQSLLDRLEFSDLTLLGVAEMASRKRMLVDFEQDGAFLEHRGDMSVRVVGARFPGPVLRTLRIATGTSPVRLARHLPWLAPSVLVLVELRQPLGSCFVLRDRRAGGQPLGHPVLDQLVGLDAIDGHSRALLSDASLVEPLAEMFGEHPLSVVTERVVAVWCTQPVADPEPLIELATEVANGLRQARHAVELVGV